jgi:hypothetical protein
MVQKMLKHYRIYDVRRICILMRDLVRACRGIVTAHDARLCYPYYKQILSVMPNGNTYAEDSACYISTRLSSNVLSSYRQVIVEFNKQVLYGSGIKKINFKTESYLSIARCHHKETFEDSIMKGNSIEIFRSFTNQLQERLSSRPYEQYRPQCDIVAEDLVRNVRGGACNRTDREFIYDEGSLSGEIDSIITLLSREILFVCAEMLSTYAISRGHEISRYAPVYKVPFDYNLNDEEFYAIVKEFILDNSYRFSISRPISRSYRILKRRHFIKYYFYTKDQNSFLRSISKGISRFLYTQSLKYYCIIKYLRILRQLRTFFHKRCFGNFLYRYTICLEFVSDCKYGFEGRWGKFVGKLLYLSLSIRAGSVDSAMNSAGDCIKCHEGNKEFFSQYFRRLSYRIRRRIKYVFKRVSKTFFVRCLRIVLAGIIEHIFRFTAEFACKRELKDMFRFHFARAEHKEVFCWRILYKKMTNRLVRFIYLRSGVLWDCTEDVWYYDFLTTFKGTFLDNFKRGVATAFTRLKHSIWGRIFYWFIKEHSKRIKRKWSRFLSGFRIINRYRRRRLSIKRVIEFIKKPNECANRLPLNLMRKCYFRLTQCVRFSLRFRKHHFTENSFYPFAIRRRNRISKLSTSMFLQRAQLVMRAYNIHDRHQVSDYSANRDIIRAYLSHTHTIKTAHMDEYFDYFQKFCRHLSKVANYKRCQQSYKYLFKLLTCRFAVPIDNIDQRELKKFFYLYFRRWVRASRVSRIDGMFYYEVRWHIRMADRTQAIIDEMEGCMERLIHIRLLIRDYVYDSVYDCIFEEFIETVSSKIAFKDYTFSREGLIETIAMLINYDRIRNIYGIILADSMYPMEVIYLRHISDRNIYLCAVGHYDCILYNSYYEADRFRDRNLARTDEAFYFIHEHVGQLISDDYFIKNSYTELCRSVGTIPIARYGMRRRGINKAISPGSIRSSNRSLIKLIHQ